MMFVDTVNMIGKLLLKLRVISLALDVLFKGTNMSRTNIVVSSKHSLVKVKGMLHNYSVISTFLLVISCLLLKACHTCIQESLVLIQGLLTKV